MITSTNKKTAKKSGTVSDVYKKVKGSCSMLVITEKGLYAARDKLGRTPVILGKKDGAYAVSSESSCFNNIGFNLGADIKL